MHTGDPDVIEVTLTRYSVSDGQYVWELRTDPPLPGADEYGRVAATMDERLQWDDHGAEPIGALARTWAAEVLAEADVNTAALHWQTRTGPKEFEATFEAVLPRRLTDDEIARVHWGAGGDFSDDWVANEFHRRRPYLHGLYNAAEALQGRIEDMERDAPPEQVAGMLEGVRVLLEEYRAGVRHVMACDHGWPASP